MGPNDEPTYLDYVRRYRKFMFDLLHDEEVEHWAKRVVISLISDTASQVESNMYTTRDTVEQRDAVTEIWAALFEVSKE